MEISNFFICFCVLHFTYYISYLTLLAYRKMESRLEKKIGSIAFGLGCIAVAVWLSILGIIPKPPTAVSTSASAPITAPALTSLVSDAQTVSRQQSKTTTNRTTKQSAQAKRYFDKGMSYFYGITHHQDHYKARKWFTKAALLGNSEAQSRLGMMLFMGHGGEKEIKLAKHWLGLALTPPPTSR